MRARIVRPREMRETFGSEVRDFPYAFVMPNHGEGWDSHALVPAVPHAPSAPSAPRSDLGDQPRRRAGDKKPTYIEIKPKP